MKDTQVEAPKKHHEGSDNIVVPGGLFGCSSLSSSGIRWSTAESSSLSLCTSHQPRSIFFSFLFFFFFFPQTHTRTYTHQLPLTPISLYHPLSSSSASLPLSQLFSAPAEETFFSLLCFFLTTSSKKRPSTTTSTTASVLFQLSPVSSLPLELRLFSTPTGLSSLGFPFDSLSIRLRSIAAYLLSRAYHRSSLSLPPSLSLSRLFAFLASPITLHGVP